MASTLSWLDYSEADRRRALDVIHLFREQDTRDELGIGSVRDAFADMLFLGTSTIQTRAKYFLFVSWTYVEMERLRVASSQVADRARSEEIRLIRALKEAGETEGVIGQEAGAALKRLPSDVYWSGLRSWGVCRFSGSRDQYHRYLDRFYRWDPGVRSDLRTDDGEPVEGAVPRNWDAHLPPRPRDFPQKTSLRLEVHEAAYLKERILTGVPGTLLAHLAELPGAFQAVPRVWDLREVGALPSRLQDQILHARNFSEVMHGAALLYNLMLSAKTNNATWIEDYRGRLTEWAGRIESRAGELLRWDRGRFWSLVSGAGARITAPTRSFVDKWLDFILASGRPGRDARGISGSTAANRLIETRELAIKGQRARLHNRPALKLWSGAAGTGQLVYRWPQAQRIVLDILDGLARVGDVDA